MLEFLPSTSNFQTKDILIPSAVVLHKAETERGDVRFCTFDILILLNYTYFLILK